MCYTYTELGLTTYSMIMPSVRALRLAYSVSIVRSAVALVQSVPDCEVVRSAFSETPIYRRVIVTDATASVTITQVAQKLPRASLYML